MEKSTQLAISCERDFHNLNLSELCAEKEKIEAKNQHLQNELSDLAFHNYRTYVDVGKTAEYCKEKFTEMDNFMHQLRSDFPSLQENIGKFKDQSKQILDEYKHLGAVESTNCIIWDILKMPEMMEKCIRAGRYEQAYAMTNFALNMKQTSSKLMQNAVFKNVVEHLLEQRHKLLDELFSKFAGPLDLARSIQIVNNIRKIPFISNTQLRVSILQYRDIYLERKVLSIMSEPDFVLRIIELYRECMYDTIVLYLAVFPDADIQRKFISMNDDPRWERWTGSSQSYLLQSWAQRNIERLLTYLRGAEHKTMFDVEAMISKLMSFAFSFGRMGLDFRSLVHAEFSQMIVEIFRKKVEQATKKFTSLEKLDLIDGDIFENTRRELLEDEASHVDLSILSAPLELCVWDDLCLFGNSIIDALNETRHSICINFIRSIFRTILASMQTVFAWLDTFLAKPEEAVTAKRAAFLLLRHFVPFINKCFFHCFPYNQCVRQYFGTTHCTLQQFNDSFSLEKSNLFALSRQDALFRGILKEAQRDAERERQQFVQPSAGVNGNSNLQPMDDSNETAAVPEEITKPEGNVENTMM